MRNHRVFCSACDRDVNVILTDVPAVPDGQASIPDSEVVCLDINAKCSAALCPIGTQPPAVMVARLARFDPGHPAHKRVRARCGGCQMEQDLIEVDRTLALCPVCKASTCFSGGLSAT